MPRQPHGQNFLIDNNIARKIVNAAGIKKSDLVVEIGPGKGILTDIIKDLTHSLTLLEIDPALSQRLSAIYAQTSNVKIENIDALNYVFPGTPYKIVSNLPYNVGTAIVQHFLPSPSWTTAVIMLQKEVALRLCAKPASADYGYISIFCAYYAAAEILFDVSPSCFGPKPKVMSSVIRLTNKNAAPPDPLFFSFIKHCFSMRRKTILNCLGSFKNLDKQKAADILATLNFDSFLRPDKLTISDYISLTNQLKKHIILQS